MSNNEIPNLQALGKLTALRELYIANNRISRRVFCVSICLTVNSIEPSIVKQLPMLSVLDLARNPINSIMDVTPLATVTSLCELRLNKCPIGTTESYRANTLSVLTQLRMLDDISASVKHDMPQAAQRPLTARGRMSY